MRPSKLRILPKNIGQTSSIPPADDHSGAQAGAFRSVITRPLATTLLLFLLAGCSEATTPQQTNQSASASRSADEFVNPEETGCRHCHREQSPSPHDFSCSICHEGDDTSNDSQVAHRDLITQPAHPLSMATTCGHCHPDQSADVARSKHFTLTDQVNLTRKAFGARETLDDPTQIPIHAAPETPLQLADDLLRRHCLRCHPYSSGDPYPLVGHGTGCAACHMDFSNGSPVSHTFLAAPGDKQCLHCHHGNWVGADYHGRFEHDFNEEYRTPYFTSGPVHGPSNRPYGVEYHQLASDVHQQKGMICVDCHSGAELMNRPGARAIQCQNCHLRKNLENARPDNVIEESGAFFLLSKKKQRHPIPLMRHPAHSEYQDTLHCQVCHAQWTFNDIGTHLLRNDTREQDDFWRLTVQGSWEVEQLLTHNLSPDTTTTLPPTMTDKFSGEQKKGIWLQGYTMRRWETIQLGRDENGAISVMRPLLDLHLSWLDENHITRFDSVAAQSSRHGLQPYTPHTTGPAGLFYRQRIEEFYQKEQKGEETTKDSTPESRPRVDQP